jgi:membrane protein implicated in regulation of membrane protease activity
MMHNILSRPEIFWFLLGLVLFLMELVMPGFIIFFFGVGAWVTALVCLIAAPGTNLQIVIFGVSSLIALMALRRVLQNRFFRKTDSPEDIEDEFTGKEATATVDFGGMRNGKVEFKGTSWTAESAAEIKDGQRVVIIEKDSFKLIVEPKK